MLIQFEPSLYYILYYFSMAFLTLYYSYRIGKYRYKVNLGLKESYFFMVAFALLFTFIVSNRPTSTEYFGDTYSYARSYVLMQKGAIWFSDLTGGDYLFSLLMYNCAKIMDVHQFFLCIGILYVVPLIIACKRLNGQKAPILLLFIFVCFSFFSYAVNGIRNGMACSLVILAMSFIQGKGWQKFICVILCVLAVSFHSSTLLPIAAMFFVYFNRKPKAMFYFWFLSIFVSLLFGNTMANIFESLGFDDRMSRYLTDTTYSHLFSSTGFRWDFLLYSVMPIWLGWYTVFKRKMWDDTYLILLGTYIYANAFWVMVIRASYSNRFAYLSWFLYGLVLAYPLMKFPIWEKNGGLKTALILIANFGFTVMMWLIGK